MDGHATMHRRAGTMGADGFALSLTPADAGWSFTGLKIAELAAGEQVRFQTGDDEIMGLPRLPLPGFDPGTVGTDPDWGRS